MALILASKSPRRRELLAQMGLTDFEIHPALGEELAQPDLPPPELVQALALHKAGTPPKESCGGTSPPANPWTRQALTASKAEAACWCPASKGTTPTWWACPSCA